VALTEIKKNQSKAKRCKKNCTKKRDKKIREEQKAESAKKKPHQEKNKVKKFRSACIFWVLVLSCIIA
jgi:predicted ribosome quality control (RQC) complex YloA/Tae2 family protein